MNTHALGRCRQRLEAFLAMLIRPMGRAERRRWAGVYIRGLLLDGERKSIEPLARRLPDGDVQALQQFVGQSPWSWEPVRARGAQTVAPLLREAVAWIVDDTGFPKQGQHSVGVARQYSGTLGKVANCQVAVSLHHATEQASVPLDWVLYLPESWTRDRARCRKAGVPKAMTFHPKWALALEAIDRAHGWGIPPGVVVADAAYGTVTAFREGLEDRQHRYVVGIDSTLGMWTTPQRRRAQPYQGRGRPRRPRYVRPPSPESAMTVITTVPLTAWRLVSWREGTKGPLRSRFTACRVQPAHGHWKQAAELPTVWLLAEWPRRALAPTRFWLSNLPGSTPLRTLVRWAKARWRIEQDYREMKRELGLDHYEGRGFTGWHHHVTLVTMAHAFLTLERLRRKKNSASQRARSATGDSVAPGDMDRSLRRLPPASARTANR